MDVLAINDLPLQPSQAAAYFYTQCLAKVEGGKGDIAITLPPAGRDHDDWRRALARDLGRENAPRRVNIIGGGDKAQLEEALAYLRNAHGITGQYLPLHD
jgi:hypothetical protein